MKITILLRTKEEESLYRKVLLKIGSLGKNFIFAREH